MLTVQTPTKRLVSKRQVYKTLGLQNVRFKERQMYKMLIFDKKHPSKICRLINHKYRIYIVFFQIPDIL
jgi:hypothetical protein